MKHREDRIQGDGVSPDIDAQGRTQQGTTSGNAGGVNTSSVRDADIGEAERATKENLSESGINYLNAKRTYDEYQQQGLTAIAQNQRVFEQAATQLQQQLTAVNQITIQHLQNAVSVANRVNNDAATVSNLQNGNISEASNKTNNRAGRMDDVAADAQWNPIQQGAADATLVRAITIDDTSLKAIGAIVASAVAEALSKKSE